MQDATELDCPISNAVRRYGLDMESVLRIVRMNWRMSVLSIISESGSKGVYYCDISKRSRLNPRTLSIILRELATEGLILKRSGFPQRRVLYLQTEAGMGIAESKCPMISAALKSVGKTRKVQ